MVGESQSQITVKDDTFEVLKQRKREAATVLKTDITWDEFLLTATTPKVESVVVVPVS
jgi:hypothetical protein